MLTYSPTRHAPSSKFTDEQLRLLGEMYEHNQCPNARTLRELAQAANMTHLQCKAWFQYQRKRRRKFELENETEALESASASILNDIDCAQKKNTRLMRNNEHLRSTVETLHRLTTQLETCSAFMKQCLADPNLGARLSDSDSTEATNQPASAAAGKAPPDEIATRLGKFLTEIPKDIGKPPPLPTDAGPLSQATEGGGAHHPPPASHTLQVHAHDADQPNKTSPVSPLHTNLGVNAVDIPSAIVQRMAEQLTRASAIVTRPFKSHHHPPMGPSEVTYHHPQAVQVRKIIRGDDQADVIMLTIVQSIESVLAMCQGGHEPPQLKQLVASFLSTEIQVKRTQVTNALEVLKHLPIVPRAMGQDHGGAMVCCDSMFCLVNQCYLGPAERSMCLMGEASAHAIIHHAIELLNLDKKSASKVTLHESMQLSKLKTGLKCEEERVVRRFEELWQIPYAFTEQHHGEAVSNLKSAISLLCVQRMSGPMNGKSGLDARGVAQEVISNVLLQAHEMYITGITKCMESLPLILAAKLFVAIHKVRQILVTADQFQAVTSHPMPPQVQM